MNCKVEKILYYKVGEEAFPTEKDNQKKLNTND